MVLACLIGCSDQSEIIDGTTEVRYYIGSYFTPKQIIAKKGSNSVSLSVSERVVSQETDPNEFVRIAKEYGENGDKVFRIPHPPIKHPYGIKSVKGYCKKDGELIDISEKVRIAYLNHSIFIQSGYRNREVVVTDKKLSALTQEDIKWIPYEFNIFFDGVAEAECYLAITLENGKELIEQIK